MRTFMCDNCYEKCCVTIQFGSNPPRRCHHDDNKSNWHEVKEEPVTDCNRLPKLTAEVFDRPDCPEWAKYAVVDKRHNACFCAEKPKIVADGWYSESYVEGIIRPKFDASDWKNSLIERPAKELPDWCKVGKYVYDASLREYLYVKEEDYDWYVDPVARGRIKQARKREFNDKEMKALVGRIFTTLDGDASIATDFDKYLKTLYIYNEEYTNKQLADSAWLLDGKPCYVLEHLNDKGEWVE